MKHPVLLLNLLLALLCASTACKPIYFESAQPKGAPNVDFPAGLQGIYAIEHDTVWVDAKGYTISETQTGTYALAEEADSYPGATRYDTPYGDGKQMTLEEEGPLWTGYWNMKDDSVAFYLSRRVRTDLNPDSVVLRQASKNVYLLNLYASEEGFWNTLQLQKSAFGGITVTWATEDQAETARKFFALKEVKNEDGEIDHYLADPAPKKLAKFVAAGGFSEPLMELEPLP